MKDNSSKNSPIMINQPTRDRSRDKAQNKKSDKRFTRD